MPLRAEPHRVAFTYLPTEGPPLEGGSYCISTVMASCFDVISGWEPRTVSPEAARFAKDVVVCLCPIAPARAKDLLYATSKLAEFCISVGLELDRETVFSPFVIERFARVGTPRASPATTRTLRTNLRFVSRRVVAQQVPEAAPLVRQRAKAPYSRDEIQARLAAAAHCGGIDRQMRGDGAHLPSGGRRARRTRALIDKR